MELVQQHFDEIVVSKHVRVDAAFPIRLIAILFLQMLLSPWVGR
jgi:hypothetical protein